MNLIGNKVKHRKFGAGTIIEIVENIIYVKFFDEERKFQFPSAFNNNFLVLENENDEVEFEKYMSRYQCDICGKKGISVNSFEGIRYCTDCEKELVVACKICLKKGNKKSI